MTEIVPIEMMALRAPPVLAATASVTLLALVDATVIQAGSPVTPELQEPDATVIVRFPPDAAGCNKVELSVQGKFAGGVVLSRPTTPPLFPRMTRSGLPSSFESAD